MYYRTRTYLAGDWTGDADLIQAIKRWNDSDRWGLSFSDAHDLTESRDTSLPCSIKKSLSTRLDASKTFVLIVGKHTDALTKGSCQYCDNYSAYFSKCNKNMHADYRSFIKFECEKAVRDNLKIVVIYNDTIINKSLCPECIKNTGNHISGKYIGTDWGIYWNYTAIKNAIED